MTTNETSIFTKIINREVPGFIPYQTDTVAVLITLEGHPIVVPKKEFKDIFELPDTVAAEIMQTAVKVAKALKETTQCEGVNLIQSNGAVAGQEVFHFHLHIKPRFKNDDVKFTWDTSTKPEEMRNELSESIKSSL